LLADLPTGDALEFQIDSRSGLLKDLAGFGFIFPVTDAKLCHIGHSVSSPARARQSISAFSNVKRAGSTASVANGIRIALSAPKAG
jgi:hypothetical protein